MSEPTLTLEPGVESAETAVGQQVDHEIEEPSAAPKVRRAGRLRRRASALLLTAATVIGVMVATTGASSAATLASGSAGSISAGGDTATHVVSSSLSALQMSNYGNGQYVSARIAFRDLSVNGGWQYSGWSAPRLVDGINTTCTYFTGCFTTVGEQDLTGFTFRGFAGHHYAVLAQFAFWLGNAYSYSGWVATSDGYLNTVYSQGIGFSVRNSYAIA